MYSQRNNFLQQIPSVTRNLIIINVLVWLASLILPKVGINLVDLCSLHYFESQRFKLHQVITYMFLHDISSPAHIFFNMFAVFMFGSVLERYWGQKRYFIFYMVTGLGAGLIQMLVYYLRIKSLIPQVSPEGFNLIVNEGWKALLQHQNYVDPVMAELNALFNGPMLGASGAVFGLLLAFGMLFPDVPLMIMFIPVPIKAKYMVIGYGLVELLLGIGNFEWDNVAHFAHLGGMIFGFILIKYWQKTKKNDGFRIQ